MNEVMTQEQFQEKFGGDLLNGLDSNSTYIPLRANKKAGINVAIRPVIIRINQDTVLFGAKLRVGYTLDENHCPVKSSVTDISPDVSAQRLVDFCQGFTWRRADERRCSTIVGFAVAASQYDGAAILHKVYENPLVEKFIAGLEATYKDHNGVGFAACRRTAIAALRASWAIQIGTSGAFNPLPEIEVLPEDVVGEQTSGILNKAEDNYHDNVVSFSKKVKELAEEAKT